MRKMGITYDVNDMPDKHTAYEMIAEKQRGDIKVTQPQMHNSTTAQAAHAHTTPNTHMSTHTQAQTRTRTYPHTP